MHTTARRTDLQTAYRYDDPSYRYPGRLWIRRLGDPYDGPPYRSATRRSHTTGRRIHSQTADRYDGSSYRYPARRTDTATRRTPSRTVYGYGASPYPYARRRIDRTDPRQESGDKKGGAPERAPRATILRHAYFSVEVEEDGSAEAAAGCGAGVGAGVGPGAGAGVETAACVSAFFRPRNGLTPNSESFSDRMP